MPLTREECLSRLNEVIEQKKVIVAAGAGIGLSAKCSQEAGADLIVTYSGARYRMAGRPVSASQLPVGDANGITLSLAAEIIPVAQDTPVIAGIFAHDPFRLMDVFLRQVQEAGFSGVQNGPMMPASPTRPFEAEIKMMAQARSLGLLTVPSVSNAGQAKEMAPFADVLVAQVGGPTGAGRVGLMEVAEEIQSIHDAAKTINPTVLVLCHGGPIAEPEDLEFVLKNTKGVAGYQGGSSIERLPVERAIKQVVRRFKELNCSIDQ